MAEVIGLAASVIALIGAASNAGNTCIKFIKSIKNAPEELGDLLSEIERFTIVLEAVRSVVKAMQMVSVDNLSSIQADLTPVVSLKRVIEVASDKLEQLKLLIEGTLRNPSAEIKKSSWAVHKRQARKLQAQLSDIQSDISNCLPAATALHHMLQMHILSKEVRLIYSNTQQLLVASDERSIYVPDCNQDALANDHGAVVAALHEQPTLLNKPEVGQQLRPLEDSTMCRPTCSCICHVVVSYASPPYVKLWAGRLRVKYRGIRANISACSTPGCKRSIHLIAEVLLPTWFAQRLIYAKYSGAAPYGPELLIKISRVVGDHFLDGLILKDDIDSFRSYYTSGRGGIHDTGSYEGINVLQQAVTYGDAAKIRFLMDSGADSSHVNNFGSSALDIAFRKTLSGNASEELLSAYRALCDWENYYIDREFTKLHLITMGRVEESLETTLRINSGLIDLVDVEGYTPLMCAIQRSNLEHTQLLLEHGAKLDAKTSAGFTALMFAAGKEPEHGSTFVDLLTRTAKSRNAAASVEEQVALNSADSSGWRAWSYAIRWHNSAALKALLAYKCATHLKSGPGSTILHHAAIWANEPVAVVLASHELSSIDVQSKDLRQDTASMILEGRLRGEVSFASKCSVKDYIAVKKLIRQTGRHKSDVTMEEANAKQKMPGAFEDYDLIEALDSDTDDCDDIIT